MRDDMDETTEQDLFDQTVRRGAHPATTITSAMEYELAALTIATMHVATPRAQRRAWFVTWVAGISAATVLGAGAAAMAVGLGWLPWAQQPDGTFSYELPSGVRCEGRIGDLQAENPDIEAAVQQVFASIDVVATSDVAEWNRNLLADSSAVEYAQASVDSGHTAMGNVADQIYGMAVSQAVLETLDDELTLRGFDMSDERNMIAVQGQALCGSDIP